MVFTSSPYTSGSAFLICGWSFESFEPAPPFGDICDIGAIGGIMPGLAEVVEGDDDAAPARLFCPSDTPVGDVEAFTHDVG
ncbi:hypothetical protein GS531_22915 [Rhodococcus hoagii]|nr:hypothetical protein [Prescottella equi]